MSHCVLDVRTASDHFPGIGRYAVNLARALAKVSPDLHLSLLRNPSAATRLALPDLPRIDCPASPFSLRQQWIVPQQLRNLQATLYHSPYYLMPYVPGVSAVFTCHDLIPLRYPQYFSAAQRLIYRLAHILALKAASMTIAVSRATRADLMRCFRPVPQRVVVIPEAADAHFAPQLPERINALRIKYALPEQYVLYFGSNKPHKNIVGLVKACKILNIKHQISNVKLVVAGHWDERYPEAMRIVEESDLRDQVVFLGPVDEADLPALYSGAVLFAFPTLCEGFGLPVLEAMACGTPVVCSSISSLPEVAGDAALLVNPLEIDELAQAIGQLWSDEELRKDMRARGLAQAARFSWEQTARETLTVYEQCAWRKT